MLFLKFLLISFRCESIKEYTTLPVDVEGKFTLIFLFHCVYILATDCHLGYMEKDQVRGNDSLVTFEEILQIAKDKDVSSLLQKRLFFSHVKID